MASFKLILSADQLPLAMFQNVHQSWGPSAETLYDASTVYTTSKALAVFREENYSLEKLPRSLAAGALAIFCWKENPHSF